MLAREIWTHACADPAWSGATHAGISARANMELSYGQYFARPIFHPVNMERPPSSNPLVWSNDAYSNTLHACNVIYI